MATSVYTVENIKLQDDDATEVLLKPLNIKNLRRFMAKMDEFAGADDETKIVDVLLEAALICIEKQVGEVGTKEWAEEALDMPTIYKIIEVCGGIKLNDPNLVEKAAETLAAQQAGQN